MATRQYINVSVLEMHQCGSRVGHAAHLPNVEGSIFRANAVATYQHAIIKRLSVDDNDKISFSTVESIASHLAGRGEAIAAVGSLLFSMKTQAIDTITPL